jgi:predicted ABC-type exoprotein transport system permease subunit
MHLLLIIIVLMIAFPMFARFVGGVLSMVFWLVLVVVVLAVFGALSH